MMFPEKFQIALTKILPPKKRADLLSRKRLLDQLDSLTENKLTLISAPAGYGKTSLLVDMTVHCGLPVGWYTLDRLDRDISRFLIYFIHAIALQFPPFGTSSEAAVRGSSFSADDLETLVTVITNDIYQHINEHFILVLDDFHLVQDVEPIITFLNLFIQRMDDNCHLILSSRTLVVLPDMPLWVARNQVGGLSYDDLAFQADEIKDLLFQKDHFTLSGEVSARLAKETEGWVTALLLSSPSTAISPSQPPALPVSGAGLYEFLYQQVLAVQSLEIQSFLLRTSFLEEFDAALCRDVLGSLFYPDGVDWEGLMAAVQQNNLFVMTVGENGSWLRYHHIFSDFLQKRLTRERPQEKDLILHQFAGVLLHRGEVERAYALYQQMGDQKQIEELITRYGSWMLRGGRLSTLSTWINGLPQGVVSRNAELLSLSGSLEVMQGQPKMGLALLDQADRMLRQQNHPEALAGNLVRRAVTHQMMGNLAESLADAQCAIQIAEQLDQEGMSIRADAFMPIGYGYFQLEQFDQAARAFEQSLAFYHALKDEDREAQAYLELANTYSILNEGGSALAAYQKALDYFRKTGNLTWQANVQNNLGVFYLDQGELMKSYQHLEDALECSRLSGYTRLEAYTLATIGDLYSTLDSWDAAHHAYQQAASIAQRTDENLLYVQILLAMANIARKQGDSSYSLSLIQSAREYSVKNLSDFDPYSIHLNEGRLFLSHHDDQEALHIFEKMRLEMGDQQNKIEGSVVAVYLAACHSLLGDLNQARSELDQAIQVSGNSLQKQQLISAARDAWPVFENKISSLAGDPRINSLISQVAQFERELPSIRRQIRRSTAAVPFGLPRINIHTLGKIQIWLDGKLVSSSQWQTQAARDLFLLLLAHPDGLTKEEIALVLWLEDSENQVKIQFKNTIYRLRKALGQNVILFEDDRYRFNQSLDYEYDVELFKSRLDQARREGDRLRKMKVWKDALELYKGPFLPMLDQEWVLAIRENLWELYLSAALAYGENLLETGDSAAALGVGTKILEQDSCQEDAFRLVMRAYAAQGNQGEVARQYERCTEILRRELDVEPSLQTRQLYQTLVHT